MMPAFGFSVGDFIAAAGLIKKISDALKDAGGASSDYQHVIIELEGLDRALKVVAALEPDHSNGSHVNAIRGMALSCQLPLRQFLDRIQRYEASLGAIPSSRTISRNARKAKWAVYVADQVQALRAVIAAKVVSINLLLNVQIYGAISKIEPAIRAERNHLMSEIFRVRQFMSEMQLDAQKAQSKANEAAECAQKAANLQTEGLVSLDAKLDGTFREVMGGLDTLSSSARSVETSVLSLRDTGQQILQFIHGFPREIRELLQKILRTNLQLYHVLLQFQSNLTKSPTMILESNIIFEDALGRTQNLPYEWFRHWETFEGLLKAEFKGIPGESKVLDGSYHLLDNKNRGQLIRKEDWVYAVTPGSVILMSMIMKQLRLRRGTCPRPSCMKVASSSATPGLTITCSDCGLKYSIMEDSIKEDRDIVEIEDEEAYISRMQVEEDIRVFGDRSDPLDLEEPKSLITFHDTTMNPIDLTTLSAMDTSYVIHPADLMNIDDVTQEEFLQDENEILHSPHVEKVTPLDTWLSQVPVVDAISDTSPLGLSIDSEDLEAKGIECFRNVHIINDQGVGSLQTVVTDKVCTDPTEDIAFAARIFYRNIRDRYPQMPRYLAHRLAMANKRRSDRLGLSRTEQDERSSSDDWDEESLDSGLDGKEKEQACQKKPEASAERRSPVHFMKRSLNSIKNVVYDTKLGISKLIEKSKPLKRNAAKEKSYQNLDVGIFNLEPSADSLKSVKRKVVRDTSYWSGEIREPSPHSSASRSSTMNSSLHGSDEGRQYFPVLRSFSTGKSSQSRPINDHRAPLLALPPPPIELGTQQSFTCDICGHTVSVLRRRDWKKHVFQDLEPYMCTYQGCPIADTTYATRRAFITHEMRHHREVARKFGCNKCKKKFDRKRDARKHIHFDNCRGSIKFNISNRGFSVTEERVADSVCPFCANPITGGCRNLTQHLGRHLEEVSFAVVRRPYEEWQFYEDSISAKSPVPSVVLNENICEATARGDVKLVMDLLIAGADVNTETDDQSLLHVASAKGHYAMVWLLLQRGADHQKKSEPKVPNDQSFLRRYQQNLPETWEEGRTALEEASINGHIEVAELLAKVASDQGFQTTNENALLLAAEFGQLNMVKEFVRCFEMVGEDCLPASLHFAAEKGHIDIVEFLLLNGARAVPTTRDSGKSRWPEPLDPLLASLKKGHKAISLLLLENGAHISGSAWYECGLSGDHELITAMLGYKPESKTVSHSALTGAAARGHTEIAIMLMENGIKVTKEAMTQACVQGHSAILNLLLDRGAIPQASDLEGAIQNRHSITIQILLCRDPGLLPELGQRAITLALNNGSVETVKLFLQLGQTLPQHIAGEDTPLHYAAAKGHDEIAQLLISEGFDVNVEGYSNENPLHRASEGGCDNTVKLLLDAGAKVNGTNGSKLRTPLAYARTQAVKDMLIEKGGFKLGILKIVRS